MTVLRAASLAREPGLGHALSTREFGPVGGPQLPGALENRLRLAVEAGGRAARLVVAHQVHGNRVALADAGVAGFEAVPETDGLVTDQPGLALLVQGADCPLIALYEPEARVVGAVHSGWRGTVARIADHALAAAAELGATPQRTLAAVFPGIGPCCFEVGPELAPRFRTAFGATADAWFTPGRAGSDRSHLDLAAVITHTLVAGGVPAAQIEVVPGCTACGGQLWSHRASKGGPERHGLVVVLR